VDYSFSKSAVSKSRQWPRLPPNRLRHRDRPTNTIGPSTLSTRRIRSFKKFSNREKTTTSKTRLGVAEIDPLKGTIRRGDKSKKAQRELLFRVTCLISPIAKLLMN